MMTPARATFTLAAGSLVSLAAGAVSAKAIAVIAGPAGVGTVGLLVSLLSLASIIGGFGVGTALVRAVAMAAAVADLALIRQLHAAARIAVLGISSIVALGLALGRDRIADLALGDSSRQGDVILIAAAVIFYSLAGVEVSLVNGLHRVGRLATITACSATATAISLVTAVALLGPSGAAVGILAGSFAGWLIALAFAAGARPGRSTAERRGLTEEIAGLLRFGGPYTASQLVGTGAQLLIPFIVLAFLTTADVGYYRAAATISVAYLAFLLNAMAQDYYPRVSAISRGGAVADVARRQLSFVLTISIPLILLTSAVAPAVVRILYSADFARATDVLRWQLVGDVLKLPAWTLSFVILARGTSGRFLLVEFIGGGALVLLTALGIATVGLIGAGIGYAGAYAIYYLAVSIVARDAVPIRPGREELAVAVVCAVLVGAEIIRPSIGDLPTSVAIGTLGLACGAFSGRRLLEARHG